MEIPFGPEFFKPFPDLVTGLGIEAGGRFVQDEKIGLVDEGTRQHQPSHHAAGEFGHPGVSAGVEGEEFEEFEGFVPGLPFGNIEVPGKHLQVFQYGQVRIETVLLLADTDTGLDLAANPSKCRGRRR